MAVGCGREVNVVNAPVRESGRGFPPRGCVRHARREHGNIPQPWEESHGRWLRTRRECRRWRGSRMRPWAFSAIYIIN